MATHKVVYRWSQDYAKRYDELDQWRESYKENCTCARAIEKAIWTIVNKVDKRD